MIETTEHLEIIGRTANGQTVMFDTKNAHAITHFQKHPTLKPIVIGALSTLSVTSTIERHEINMGETIGLCDLVATTDTDVIVYAKRPLRHTYSRFVKNRTSEPTPWVTLDVRKQADEDYILYTAFIGRLVPSFPGGNFHPEQSRDFWSCHALVWGSQEIVSGTETTVCPW
jgi:hypothetical protein